MLKAVINRAWRKARVTIVFVVLGWSIAYLFIGSVPKVMQDGHILFAILLTFGFGVPFCIGLWAYAQIMHGIESE